MSVKLLTEHNWEFLSLKGGCRGSYESTLVKMPHCWKSHAMAIFFKAGEGLKDLFSPFGRHTVCKTLLVHLSILIRPSMANDQVF